MDMWCAGIVFVVLICLIVKYFLNQLPFVIYYLAILCGVVLIGFTIFNADKLSSIQIGYLFGGTAGGVISMIAVGRIIEVLHQIRDK